MGFSSDFSAVKIYDGHEKQIEQGWSCYGGKGCRYNIYYGNNCLVPQLQYQKERKTSPQMEIVRHCRVHSTGPLWHRNTNHNNLERARRGLCPETGRTIPT